MSKPFVSGSSKSYRSRYPYTYAAGAVLPAGAYAINKMLQYRSIRADNNARQRYSRSMAKARKTYRPYRKYGKKCSRKVNNISKQVKTLQKKVNASLSTYIKKSRSYGSAIIANVEECVYSSQTVHNISVLQGVIDSVKYFDPATPATLINVDLSAPTFQNQVDFTSSYSSVIAMNNYSVPVRVRSYFFEVRKDTSIAPETAISNGLTDMSNGTITSPLIYPSDVHDLNDLWSVKSSKSALLMPGQELQHSWNAPSFKYDVSLSDSHNTTYQKYFHGCVHVFRIEGVPSHGSTSGQTQGKAGIDWIFNRIHKVEYPGGSNIKYLEVDLTSGSAVGTVQCSLPSVSQETYTL